MGLGSIIGTGIFVAVAVATEISGPAVLPAIFVAAVVAGCNGLSSAQLAAALPVSGGTYEYGHRWLHPCLGFTAGWMFVCAKSASAATAALGFAAYGLHLFNQADSPLRMALAGLAVAVLTVLILGGLRRSNRANVILVSISVGSLLLFVAALLPAARAHGLGHFSPFLRSSWGDWFESVALMFVAFTGYGRIATLGEEVVSPGTTIPRAIVATLAISMLLYLAVASAAIAAVGSEGLVSSDVAQGAPLEAVVRQLNFPLVGAVVALGATAAMLGVLLNLILGLSRVVLAMGRRRDLPALFAHVDTATSVPKPAVLAVGLTTAGLAFLGDVKTTWSFSAFSVLVYYAITNLAALRLTATERLFPRAVPLCGLASCLFLAFHVERRVWMTGLGLVLAGLVWWFVAERSRRAADSHSATRRE